MAKFCISITADITYANILLKHLFFKEPVQTAVQVVFLVFFLQELLCKKGNEIDSSATVTEKKNKKKNPEMS